MEVCKSPQERDIPDLSTCMPELVRPETPEYARMLTVHAPSTGSRVLVYDEREHLDSRPFSSGQSLALVWLQAAEIVLISSEDFDINMSSER